MGLLPPGFVGGAPAAPVFPPIGTIGQSLTGKFIWFDLVTDDLAAEQRFYGAVFGWQFDTIGSAPGFYTVIEHDGRNIAGMFVHPPPPDEAHSARWLSLISVSDPDRVVRYVERSGGSVLVPLKTIAGRGTHALFRDPQGAIFGVLKSASGDPPDTPVAVDEFFWLDLLTYDPDRAAEFYQGLAGYQVSFREFGPGVRRSVLASEGYARAGIAPLPERAKQPGWLPYVLVDDVRATLDKVRKSGGEVLVEPRPDLLAGELAVIADPRGGILGVLNWTQTQAGESAP